MLLRDRAQLSKAICVSVALCARTRSDMKPSETASLSVTFRVMEQRGAAHMRVCWMREVQISGVGGGDTAQWLSMVRWRRWRRGAAMPFSTEFGAMERGES